MGMVMIKCPQTGRAIQPASRSIASAFGAARYFFSRTRCPVCHADHAWFARKPGSMNPALGRSVARGLGGLTVNTAD